MIGAGQRLPENTLGTTMDVLTPEHTRVVHRSLLYDLWDIAAVGGIAGPAVRDLIARLTSHFSREEELLRSIHALARPGPRSDDAPEPEDIEIMAGFLDAELDDLRREHMEFEPAIRELEEVAEAVFDERLFALAHRLAAHLSEEERVHFPAAGLIGRTFIPVSVQ